MTKNKVLNAHVLAALAPGARVNFKTLEIAVTPDPNDGTLLLNVGGQIFETYRSTLNRHNNTNLSNEMFLRKFYREHHKDYFFDRDPVCFRSILEYLRTGQLHLPSNVCGPALKKELDFWGISEHFIEGCCWNIYDSWNSTYESLLRFDRDRKAMFTTDELDISQMSSWQRFKNNLWNILSNHNYSLLSKVYGIISLSFVIISILTFIVETHPFFKTRGDQDILGRQYRQWNTTSSDDPQTEVNMPHISIVFMDVICLVFFTLEFILRLLCAPKKCKFFFTFPNMVDLAALLPDVIEIILIKNVDYEFIYYITILRLIRILRIFRLIRHIPGLWVMMYTLKASLEELLLMCIFLLVAMIIFASLIFFVGEDRFSNIPMSLWWALITMTTVGYGDMVPTTNLGYVIGSLCALTGLLMIGFTVPIIVNHFVLNYTHMQSATKSEMRQKHRQKEIEEERKLMGKLKAEFSESKKISCKKDIKTTLSPKKQVPAYVWIKKTENGNKSELSNLNELSNIENCGNGISNNKEKVTDSFNMEHKYWNKSKVQSSFCSTDDNEPYMDRNCEENNGAKCKIGKFAKKFQSMNKQSFPMEEFDGDDFRISDV